MYKNNSQVMARNYFYHNAFFNEKMCKKIVEKKH